MLKATATIVEVGLNTPGQPKSLHVNVRWDSTDPAVKLDRHDGFGWGLRGCHQKLAERLARAINAGVVFRNPTIATDVNGKTYVTYDSVRMIGRTLNADLTRIGF